MLLFINLAANASIFRGFYPVITCFSLLLSIMHVTFIRAFALLMIQLSNFKLAFFILYVSSKNFILYVFSKNLLYYSVFTSISKINHQMGNYLDSNIGWSKFFHLTFQYTTIYFIQNDFQKVIFRLFSYTFIVQVFNFII